MATSKRRVARELRQTRIRRAVRGTDGRPRLCVYRSNRHIYAQVISDDGGRTLLAASTVKLGDKGTSNRQAARKIGEQIAQLCQERDIHEVVFDRNGFLFHGRVKEVADGARAGGLKC